MSPDSVWSALLWLMNSRVLALPIAGHRERSMIGLRTLPLVSIASCGFLLVGLEVAADDPNANARLVSGLMTGIGFIGGGAILKEGDHVRGTSTAAAVWATGAIGASVAFQRLELAVAIALVTFGTFLILTPLGKRIDTNNESDDTGGESG